MEFRYLCRRREVSLWWRVIWGYSCQEPAVNDLTLFMCWSMDEMIVWILQHTSRVGYSGWVKVLFNPSRSGIFVERWQDGSCPFWDFSAQAGSCRLLFCSGRMLLEKKEPDFTSSTRVEREEERNLIGGNELRRTSCENLEGSWWERWKLREENYFTC
jgi:hypothetical protein